MSADNKAGGERVLERWLEKRSDGAGPGRGAGRNQQRTGNRQMDTRGAETEGVVDDTAGLFTGKLTGVVGRGQKAGRLTEG